jgi:hypothetical protein
MFLQLSLTRALLWVQLTENRKVIVKKFKGHVLIDIREFFDKDGTEKPGRKGISLTSAQWEALKTHVEEVDDAVKQLS